MRQLPIDMKMLAEFYQLHRDGFGDYEGAYLDTETGDVVLVEPEALTEIEDTERYVRVPSVQTQHTFEDMTQFAQSLRNEELQRRVLTALNGKGAFRRFKDTIRSEPAVQKGWFAFRDARDRDTLLRWLVTLDIQPVDSDGDILE